MNTNLQAIPRKERLTALLDDLLREHKTALHVASHGYPPEKSNECFAAALAALRAEIASMSSASQVGSSHTMKDECNACGSSLQDREKYKATIPVSYRVSTDLVNCPFCGSTKCIMCDLGQDVRCMSCEEDFGLLDSEND